jgi:hypothetical protein
MQDFSREEMLLLDLLWCTSPILYELVIPENKRSDGTFELPTYIKIMPITGNRLQSLRSLASVAEASIEARNILVDKLRLVRNQNPDVKSDIGPVTTCVFPHKEEAMDSLIGNSQELPSTLEERVAARAKAKNLNFPQNQSGVTSNLSLLLADALWSHSRHVQRHQTRLHAFQSRTTVSSKANKFCSPCVLTLKDMVKLIPNKSRQEMIHAICDLHKAAPHWILLDSLRAISKHSTVWIQPVKDYPTLRKNLIQFFESTSDIVTSPVISESLKESTASHADKKIHFYENKVDSSLEKISESTSNHETLLMRESVTEIPLVHEEIPCVKNPDLPERLQTTSKQRISSCPASQSAAAPSIELPINEGENSQLGKAKRRSTQVSQSNNSTGDSNGTPLRKKARKTNGLRINPFLILTDADYEGGEVIAPSYTSPRGLKLMLNELNSGHRI